MRHIPSSNSGWISISKEDFQNRTGGSLGLQTARLLNNNTHREYHLLVTLFLAADFS
jgi:hypothetical protein